MEEIVAKINYIDANNFERSTYDKSVAIVKERASVIDDLVNEIVQSHSSELDALIEEIRNSIYNNAELADYELDIFIAKIPLQLYYLSGQLGHLETEESIAKVTQKIAYNEARLRAEGTVSDKDSKAEQAVEQETLVTIVFTRSKKCLQDKRDLALELLNSLKKIVSRRISEYEMTRFSNNS